MKNLKLSMVTLLAISSLVNAGGDLVPVTEYEIEDSIVAEYEYVAPAPEPVIEYVQPVQEYITPEPVYVEPVEEYIAPEPVIEYVTPEPVYVEPVEEYIAPEPVIEYVTPEPVYVEPKPQPVVIAPVPVPIIASKKISPSGFYAGLGITGAKYKDNCKCKNGKGSHKFKDTTYGAMARVGYDINQYIGVEARGSKTNWDSHGSKVEHAGIYAKPMLPVGSATNIYGLVGLAKTKVTSKSGKTPKVNADGLALGIGMEMDLSRDVPKDGRYSRSFDGQGDQEKGLGLFVDYERMLVKKNAPDLDAVSAGVTYDF
ncbi:MAG: outer membrane beta-barrel protein [Sulfurovaceae bacterium]|nr:outer membrane beta-barrel protein [Sulfurovaceae bacterium]